MENQLNTNTVVANWEWANALLADSKFARLHFVSFEFDEDTGDHTYVEETMNSVKVTSDGKVERNPFEEDWCWADDQLGKSKFANIEMVDEDFNEETGDYTYFTERGTAIKVTQAGKVSRVRMPRM